jgi:hypothetical protein
LVADVVFLLFLAASACGSYLDVTAIFSSSVVAAIFYANVVASICCYASVCESAMVSV